METLIGDSPFDLQINKGSFSLTMAIDMKGNSKMAWFMVKVFKMLKIQTFNFLSVLRS